jgi:long-chain acyl-CoA synthetase
MSRLSSAIAESFTRNRKRPYLIGGSEFRFGQLEQDVAAFAAFLGEDNSAGKRVVIATANERALLTTFFASLVSGATAVILDSRAPVIELSSLITAADAQVIVADRDLLDRLSAADVLKQVSVQVPVTQGAPAKGGLRLFGSPKPVDSDASDFASILVRNSRASLACAQVGEEAIAYILFTSGTTSRPKGVMISHRALFAQMRTFISNYRLDENSKVMNLLPFHHTDGLTQGATVCLLAGSCLVRPYAFTPDVLPQMMLDLYKHAVTHLVTVPSVMALTKAVDDGFDGSFDYPEFRFVISTAAYLDPGLWEACEKRFGIQIVNVYGLTETVCETMYCGPAAENRRVGSVGKPIDSLAKIVDEEDHELGDGQSGELLVGGDHIMSGYYNNPEATEAVLKDGWFRTGDLAKRDEDGFYYIVGRKKDLIISAGMNIYPEDVSNILRTVPGVLDAVTFGEPDALWGERAISCVLCDPAVDPSVEAIVVQFLERGSRQKLPHDILKLHSFPRGPAGKVVMSEIKEIYRRSRKIGEQRHSGEQHVEDGIYAIAADILRCPVDQLSPAAQAETVPGWTSLSHVELMIAIEEHFDFKLTAHEIMRFRTLGDVIDVVRARTAA